MQKLFFTLLFFFAISSISFAGCQKCSLAVNAAAVAAIVSDMNNGNQLQITGATCEIKEGGNIAGNHIANDE